jgi:hypothetical protein
VTGDARALARHIAKLPVSDKDRLLTLVAEDQAARAGMELLRGSGADPDKQRDSRSRRTVAELLACSAGGERVARLPRSRPSGNNNGRQPGKGAWTNRPTTPRPPGPAPKG